jgi:tripeptidyl-peptidase-1
VSLLNDYRIANGKPSLGFLNPLLYSTAFTGLNDITVRFSISVIEFISFGVQSGSNPGCGTNGFSAAVGWDPVSSQTNTV